jgi:hypothetical protein
LNFVIFYVGKSLESWTIIFIGKKSSESWTLSFLLAEKFGKLNFVIFNGGKRCGKLDFVIFDGEKFGK